MIYVNIIPIEEAGNKVIVPWESTWWFRVVGTPKWRLPNSFKVAFYMIRRLTGNPILSTAPLKTRN